jgi:hypothetical protein
MTMMISLHFDDAGWRKLRTANQTATSDQDGPCHHSTSARAIDITTATSTTTHMHYPLSTLLPSA